MTTPINAVRFGRVLLIALFGIGLSLASADRAGAQLVAGAGLKYATEDWADLGIQVGAYFGLPAVVPGLRVGGDISYYFPKSETETFFGETFESEVSIFAVNINGQYLFPLQPNLSVYGLAGLSIQRASVSVTVPGFGSESDSTTETGLNLGGGAEFGVGFGVIYGEAKIVTGDLDRVALSAGVRIPIGQ